MNGGRQFEEGSSLMLYNVQRSTAGLYVCTADNGVGEAVSQTVTVTVRCECSAVFFIYYHYWYCSQSMRQGLCNGTVSVRPSLHLSVPAVDHCSSVQRVCSAAVGPASNRSYNCCTAGAQQQRCHSSTAVSSKGDQCHFYSRHRRLNSEYSRLVGLFCHAKLLQSGCMCCHIIISFISVFLSVWLHVTVNICQSFFTVLHCFHCLIPSVVPDFNWITFIGALHTDGA